MNQAEQQAPQGDVSPPPMRATEPPFIGRGHPEFHFVQAIMELKTTIHQMDTDQKVSMARMEEKMGSVKDAIESNKKKLFGIESDVAEFKQIRHTAKVIGWIVGVTCALVLGVAGYVAKEVWSVLKPSAISAFSAPAQATQEPQLPPQKPPKK